MTTLQLLRRSYEPGDWWRVPLLCVALLLARLVQFNDNDEGE